MSRRCLLLLDNRGLSAWSWERGRLGPLDAFDSTPPSIERFAQFLAARHQHRFSLLAILDGEERLVETIPTLRGRHRQEVVRRLLARHFPETSLTCVESLGHEKTQRRNEKLLIAALPDMTRIRPWLEQLSAAGAVLCGIYSAGQFAGPLFTRLEPKLTRGLLLTVHGQILCESFVVNGRAWLTRQIPLAGTADIAANCHAEAGRLMDYLIARRLVARGERLRLTIVAPSQAIPELAGMFGDDARFSCNPNDIGSAAARLKMHPVDESSGSDALFLHLLATAAPRRQFANGAILGEQRLARWRLTLVAAMLAILLTATLFSAWQAATAKVLRMQAATLADEASRLERRRHEATASLPAIGIEHASLRRLIDRYREFERLRRQPGPAWHRLSAIMDRMPAIHLEALEWKFAQNFPSTANDDEVITITGTSPADGNILDDFIAHLRADAGQQVTLLHRPSQAGTPHAFVVEIRRKPSS